MSDPASRLTSPDSVESRLTELLADVVDQAQVLVVDDDPLNVDLLVRMLQQAGMSRVHGLTEPSLAADHILTVGADLVLLDLHMPGLDGFGVLAQLQDALDPDDFVPVLVLTADATDATRDRALQSGAHDLLTKPLDRIEVALRVRNLLRTRALYRDVQARHRAAMAELERRRATERRAEHDRQVRLDRIESVLRHGSFGIVLQPIADLHHGTVVGVEALARFTGQPYRPPNEWFEDAVSVGRSHELELATVAAALQLLPTVPDAAYLAMNVSAETAVRRELADLLAGRPLDRIVLELTEHSRVDDYSTLLAGIAPLRRAGLRLAVDDAGAGYAGLHQLLRLCPDIVKLDRQLITGIDADAAKRALTAALVGFTGETGTVLVAEGIETDEELATLRGLGVRWGQGYLLARPDQPPVTAQVPV